MKYYVSHQTEGEKEGRFSISQSKVKQINQEDRAEQILKRYLLKKKKQ